MRRRVFWIFIAAALSGSISGCSRGVDVKDEVTAPYYRKEEMLPEEAMGKEPDIDDDYQVSLPQKGEMIAVIHVRDYGDIKLKLFPQDSPKAVENFIRLAQVGYYDGVLFHRVVQDFMIQSGDLAYTEADSDSILIETFENEYSDILCPIRGALCMARKRALDTNESQFFIVQAGEVSESDLNRLNKDGVLFSEFMQKKFLKYGGAPHLAVYHHTTFGQVYEGMDIVDKIAAVEVVDKGVYDRPAQDIVVESIEILDYQPIVFE